MSERDELIDVVLAVDTILPDVPDPRDQAGDIVDALLNHLGWEYVAYVTADFAGDYYGQVIDSDTPMPNIPATHRRRKAGPWELVPPDDRRVAPAIMYGTDPAP